jgi:NAD(P)-dependent dehydrogenase (short-subunit alcohol dehydrogenase family)
VHNALTNCLTLLLPCLQAVLPHLKEGASIINTSSITAYKGSPQLVDYSSTKGAQVSTAGTARQSMWGKAACHIECTRGLGIALGGTHVGVVHFADHR